jgi:hypothetical protein
MCPIDIFDGPGIQDYHCKSYRELGIAPATCKNFQSALNIRSYHGHVTRELTDRDKEITKQDEQAVELYQESSQGPAEQNEEDTDCESSCSLKFLRAGEKDDGLLDSNDESQSDQEKDLASLVVFMYIGACGVRFP